MFISVFSLFLLSTLDAAQILKKADEFRSPSGGFEADVRVTDRGSDESTFRVFIDGNDKSLMVTQSPARDVGRNMLMLDRDIWMFIPSVSRPVRVALRQRLFGQVAQGDIARMRWHGDYKSTLTSEKPEIKNGKSALRLELKAAKPNLTYDRLNIWVDPKDYRPLEAEFLTPNGKVLKTATFENYGPLAGKERARLIKLQDALRERDFSEIQIRQMTPRNFPSGFFSQANLAKPKIK